MKDTPSWRIGALMAAYYGMNAVFQNYITVYFGSIGLTDGQISLLMTMLPLVAMVAQATFGAVGDRAKVKNRVLRFLYLASAALVCAMALSTRFAYLLAVMIGFSFFFTPLSPLTDAIALEALGGKPFGPVRLCGSLTYAVVAASAGALLGLNIQLVLWVSAATMGLAVGISCCVPPVPGHRRPDQPVALQPILRQRELLLLMGFLVVLQSTFGYFYTFFSLHFYDISGGRTDLLGLCYVISSVSETPYLIFSDRLYRRFGAGRMMLVAACAMTLRWLLLGVLQNVYLVMATQVLHSLGFIVLTVSMAHYLYDHVPPELRATGQMLLAVVGYGFARVVGNLGGGLLISLFGRQGTFLFNAFVVAAAACAYLLLSRRFGAEKTAGIDAGRTI